MNELDWLIGHRFQSLVKREYDWVFTFENDVSLTVQCLWRLLEAGRIRITSADDGHAFGLTERVNATVLLNQIVGDAVVKSVKLQSGTLDLDLTLGAGHVLQIVPDSSGYESWIITSDTKHIIAVGGGTLANFSDNPSN